MNMNYIYNKVLDGYDINKELLYSLGYTDNDIHVMLRDRLLKESDGKYMVSDHADLYKYFNKIKSTAEFSKLANLLDIIIDLKPDGNSYLFQRFYISLRLGDFQKALECFKKSMVTSSFVYSHDTNLQLFLLSKLIYVGDDLANKANLISYKDVCIPEDDTRYNNKSMHNNARKEILKGNFKEGERLMLDAHEEGTNFTFQEYLLKTLLNRVNYAYENGRKYRECIFEGRYSDAILALNNKQDRTMLENLLLELLDFIVYTPEYIPVNYDHKNGLWESVEAYDFDNALEMATAYNEDKGLDDETSPLIILLRECQSITNCDIQEVEEEIDPYEKVYYISELISSGLSFEEALNVSNFDEEVRNFVTLIYSRESYRYNNLKAAKKYIKSYISSNNKTKANKELYHKIIDSKDFLKFRETDLQTVLKLV